MRYLQVKCQLGGHEMQCKAETIESYVNGKKFKKLRDKNQDKLPEKLSFSKIHQYVGDVFATWKYHPEHQYHLLMC